MQKPIGIYTNPEKDPGGVFTNQLKEWLINNNCKPITITKTESSHMQLYSAKEIDFLICLGGDGTMLKAAGDAAICGIPLLGINLGNMGYLTDVEKADAYTALNKILAGAYKLEKRMMLDTDLSAYGLSAVNPALNEICVSKDIYSKMICIMLYINDEYIDTYRCDGIIISTPTGSTAYNLSAGGPILKPDGNMISITPICSHALYTRPFVISADDHLLIRIADKGASCGTVSMDGKALLSIGHNDSIKISRSSYHTTIMKTNSFGFYDILREKMLRVN